MVIQHKIGKGGQYIFHRPIFPKGHQVLTNIGLLPPFSLYRLIFEEGQDQIGGFLALSGERKVGRPKTIWRKTEREKILDDEHGV